MNDATDVLRILQGDAIEQLRTLPDESVHCCVTSPPYWGLRDYGSCDCGSGRFDLGQGEGTGGNLNYRPAQGFKNDCPKCNGSGRIIGTENQLGLEKTPREYVAKMVEVFREVRRVLRKDGTLWLNLGDSYASAWACSRRNIVGNGSPDESTQRPNRLSGCTKEKDLLGIPWEVVKAMQRPYYTGRIKSERDRIWLASTIDAEGSICGFTHTRKDNGDIRRGIHLTITNTNVRMLDECFRIWPTSKKDHNQHGRGHLGLLECHRWIAHDISEKQQLLAELYPYLICKKLQAMLAWNFCEISKQARGRTKNAENQERCAWIVQALSKLNHLQSIDFPNWIKEPPTQYEDGWWLRSDIIWAKPNPMPESVTDRPTKAHEYLFLLTKSANYFYDAEAIKEGKAYSTVSDSRTNENGQRRMRDYPGEQTNGGTNLGGPEGNRNKRSVWTVATAPYPEAHFATYPPDLIKPCILAGTSAKGCCAKCGSPWERVVENKPMVIDRSERTHSMGHTRSSGTMLEPAESKTIGWQPTCKCDAGITPCSVLDCFAGSGTTGAVALELGRKAVLIELNPKYVELIEQRCDVTMGLALA